MVLLIVSFLSLFCFYFRYVWGILFLRVSAETDLNAYRVILRLGHYALVSSLEKKRILTPFVLQNKFTAHFSPMIIFLLFSVYSCGSNPVPEEYSDIGDNILHALPPSGIYYYSHDHLGSSSLITDSNGEEVIRTHYTPYGEVDLHYTGKYNIPTLEERSSDPNPISNDRSDDFTRNGAEDPKHASLGLKFTGQDYDPESNLYYYNARYYDPTIGLFTTADKIVPSSTDSQAFNRYMYVRGSPVTYTDPSGHGWKSFWKKVGNGITKAAKWTYNNILKPIGYGLAAAYLSVVALVPPLTALAGGIAAAVRGESFWSGFGQGLAAGLLNIGLAVFTAGVSILLSIGNAVAAGALGIYSRDEQGVQAFCRNQCR